MGQSSPVTMEIGQIADSRGWLCCAFFFLSFSPVSDLLLEDNVLLTTFSSISNYESMTHRSR